MKNKKPLTQTQHIATAAVNAVKLSKAASTPKKKARPASLQKEKKKERGVSTIINLSREEIALRAYFISKRRSELGFEGNEKTDWIDAEKQLLAEMLEKQSEK